MNGTSISLALLLDTHILVWIGAGDRRLKPEIAERIADPDTTLYLSAVVAWEYADLEKRGRFAGAGPLLQLIERLEIETLPLPGDLWVALDHLPDIHRDPLDRMLAAHALALDLPLVTADRHLHRYPIETVW